ncbi:uncharacterized protein LOC123566550 [Mercenaria mercenaria]|uniref:uncharacterized protein LOC123566550 n=1 Tax=Mercenaria mercenaria TaxID=6596 RepID=UPI001E1E1935|nr:uncharacterized protein LOC123566550 [Mercenaria mercenaria]XP_045216694.1 uncharacterized protein LOC123566550 [Mercenaria mercenaria]
MTISVYTWCAVPFTIVVPISVLLLSAVECTHQRWWLYGCQCSNWESRESVREVVMNSYRGLFVGRDDLNNLPVVKLHKNPGEAGIQSYVANTLPHINQYMNPGCCSTDYRYEIFNTTTVNAQKFKVVHFNKAFQFVPTGRCRVNSTCSGGECLQMYRHHWMLVWDERLSTWPPVTFLPVEVPSHCQCVNVGRAVKRRKRRGACETNIYIEMKEHQEDIPTG